jgi:hypothetical protein
MVEIRTSTPASAEVGSALATSYALMIAPFAASSLFDSLSLDAYAVRVSQYAASKFTGQADRASKNNDGDPRLRRALEQLNSDAGTYISRTPDGKGLVVIGHAR